MKKRILFVDDEPMVLQGLQRLLRPMRDSWETDFAESGAIALERLRVGPCDVVVSDLFMPGMNGVQLLERVRLEWPKTVRLILSGHTAGPLALQCVGIAHQFLSKPCNVEFLRNTITRVTDQAHMVGNEQMLRIVGSLKHLPSLPAIYLQLVKLLDDPASSIDQVGRKIERDIALTAHILRIVNSAFFGLAQRMNRPAEAVAYLGRDTLKAVILAAGFLEQWKIEPASGYSVECATEHAQKVGAIARVVAETEGASMALANECFVAGLLHDVGKLVLAANLPSHFAALLAKQRSGMETREFEFFGTTHAEIGSYLMGLWGLPAPIVDAIRFHHVPSASHTPGFTSLTAVHVADLLVARSPEDGQISHALDDEYLVEIGLSHRMPAWCEAVETHFAPITPNVLCN